MPTAEAIEMPEAVVEAFRVKPLMPFLELARLLGMDPTTLRDHVNAGDIPWRQKGVGKSRLTGFSRLRTWQFFFAIWHANQRSNLD